MKSVLISIQPKWCELIATGKKTIEVRKAHPKIDTPFKCYIYCTKDNSTPFLLPTYSNGNIFDSDIWQRGNGKVIGEFLCDEIKEFYPTMDLKHLTSRNIAMVDESQVNMADLFKYAKGKILYGWHISDLKIYDKPKELSDFNVVDKDKLVKCPYRERICQNPEFTNGNWLWGGYSCSKMKEPDFDIFDFCRGGCADVLKPLTRPPQSWCYVEEV